MHNVRNVVLETCRTFLETSEGRKTSTALCKVQVDTSLGKFSLRR